MLSAMAISFDILQSVREPLTSQDERSGDAQGGLLRADPTAARGTQHRPPPTSPSSSSSPPLHSPQAALSLGDTAVALAPAALFSLLGAEALT